MGQPLLLPTLHRGHRKTYRASHLTKFPSNSEHESLTACLCLLGTARTMTTATVVRGMPLRHIIPLPSAQGMN